MSAVWTYFTISEKNPRMAICKACNKNISRGGSSAKTFSTSGLLYHLKSKHPDSEFDKKATPKRKIHARSPTPAAADVFDMESAHPVVTTGMNEEESKHTDGSMVGWSPICLDDDDPSATQNLEVNIKSEPKMDSQFRIGFIGAGNMAFGIAKGILSGCVLPTNVKVSAPSLRNLGRFQELNITTSHSNTEVVCTSDVIFVAVKPHLVPIVLNEISQHVTDKHTIVSVAAGVTLATLEELLPQGSCVIRLMPNLPCVVLEGALLFARGTNAKQEHGALLCSLLQHCGLVEEGPEAWIDVHTGLSGSGVAFVYLFAEALADGAVKMGMPSALAQRIASQTVLGAGHLLRDSNKHPAQLRSEVCTPGGTTICGLHALEQGGVRASTITAVESATERARELGRKSAAPGSRK
ncbi:pyrroline-5-carboxylate reductase 3 isoform X1 [Phyllopteryx taeniolatus]|uniref:pyrroline-5-carboxylate reductase 3 isoform X1 n=2 Tax=Phyllopteryx taeniolatus TaxID=161469 RepID=UPI002AD2E920|nr:pyrroline-5-carboxylate reductase 3 isoform X1 [Phyllopteryx taeniolatus]